MVEATVRSYDPLRYYVNNVSDFDRDIVQSHQEKDGDKIREILGNGSKSNYDIFICVNKAWHAFVLCAPNESVGPFTDMLSQDPFDIPSLLFVFEIELRFENEELGTYKISERMELFKDIEHKIKKSYFIGRYNKVHVKAFQFASLRAAPHRYSVMLDDCVEFSKEFCVQLLAFCGNYSDLEQNVHQRIHKATATGLSAEQLSRRIRSSAWTMNAILGGSEVTSYLTRGRHLLLFVLLLISQVIVAIIVCYFMK